MVEVTVKMIRRIDTFNETILESRSPLSLDTGTGPTSSSYHHRTPDFGTVAIRSSFFKVVGMTRSEL